MMDGINSIGNDHPEDVKWLCSLSESELDMLISLKKLALQRAKAVGHESLAKKFDLKMLRALGFILMQVTKSHINDSQLTGFTSLDDLFDRCNLLNLDVENRTKTREQSNTEEQADEEQATMTQQASEEQATTTQQASKRRANNNTQQANSEKQVNIREQATARSSEVAVKLKRKRRRKKADGELSRQTSKD